ncbi:pentatricopeptide repeat-containing protein-like [Iris pallida]|uniref:Pentatricopeptide repeat-containing protein-like n=1 Tax=Iris pallida TaxID=29817 RepID=A0AAX6HAS3_IRIPA|nr:pentatricopeptide repeat-containing protein-like [Iris pallida]
MSQPSRPSATKATQAALQLMEQQVAAPPHPDTLTALLRACAESRSLPLLRRAHRHIQTSSPSTQTPRGSVLQARREGGRAPPPRQEEGGVRDGEGAAGAMRGRGTCPTRGSCCTTSGRRRRRRRSCTTARGSRSPTG